MNDRKTKVINAATAWIEKLKLWSGIPPGSVAELAEEVLAAADRADEVFVEDGTKRRLYYGSGKQPWDFIKEEGWDPEMAAGTALKYVRRDKGTREEDLEKGRWYAARLVEAADRGASRASGVLDRFEAITTPEERALLFLRRSLG